MQLSKYALLLGLLSIMCVTGLVGSHFGYVVNGVPQGATLVAEGPGILGVLFWIWDAVKFLFMMVTFQIDGMPVFVGMIFIVMSVMTTFLIISLVRGSD